MREASAAARGARVFFLLRNVLAGLPVAAALALAGAGARSSGVSTGWMLGLALAATGVALRAWSVCHNSYGSSRHKTLAVAGPYAWVRNPLYLANAAIIAGAAAAPGVAWLAPIAFAWAIGIFDRVVRREEARLVERYGTAYRDYARSVRRWWPRAPSASARSAGTQLGDVLRALPGQAGGLALFALVSAIAWSL